MTSVKEKIETLVNLLGEELALPLIEEATDQARERKRKRAKGQEGMVAAYKGKSDRDVWQQIAAALLPKPQEQTKETRKAPSLVEQEYASFAALVGEETAGFFLPGMRGKAQKEQTPVQSPQQSFTSFSEWILGGRVQK